MIIKKMHLLFVLMAMVFCQTVLIAQDDSLVTGWLLLIKNTQPCAVYIDDDFYGMTPLLLTDLKPGTFIVKLASETHYHARKVRVVETISKLTTYEPVMEEFKGNLLVFSNPQGAKVFIDGENRGVTPFKLNSVKAGAHTLQLVLEGFYDPSDTILIPPLETLTLNKKLARAFTITFNPPLPDNTALSFQNSAAQFEFNSNAKILLPAGDWDVTIKGAAFHTATMVVSITDTDREVAFEPQYYKQQLVLLNLQPNSLVFFGGTALTENLGAAAYPVAPGMGKLIVLSKKVGSLLAYPDILPDQDTIIDLHKMINPAIKPRSNQHYGNWFIGIGTCLLAGGVILFNNIDASDTLKYVTLGAAGAGALLVLTGIYCK